MTTATSIAPELPYLRRFARALTGSQASGDAYVTATLEAVLAGGATLDSSLSPRAALYQVFLRVWTSVPVNRRAMAPADDPGARTGAKSMADKNLALITPLPRVAFLLHAVEGFATDEIAAALDRSESEAEALIALAGREIAAEIRTDVLVIEDEPAIAIDLETLVEDLGHHVVAIARTRAEATSAAARHGPGLVLADVQLADNSSGIDAVDDILKKFDVPVIFVTAYPERLLTGERPEPAFLISKPFRPETVQAAVSQALFFRPSVGGCGGSRTRETTETDS